MRCAAMVIRALKQKFFLIAHRQYISEAEGVGIPRLRLL